jgi:hypothetical protein
VIEPGSTFHGIRLTETDETNSELLQNNPGTVGFTMSFYGAKTGSISWAEVFVNSAHHEFGDATDSAQCPQGRVFDLQAVLVHEIGHALGFAMSSDPASVLYGPPGPCDATHRTLGDDDRLAVCSVYPTGQPLKPCSAPPPGSDAAPDLCTVDDNGPFPIAKNRGCGCTTAGSQSDSPPLLILGVAYFVIWSRIAQRSGIRRRSSSPCGVPLVRT